MANITWLGASYSDVPWVTLPRTGGGTAQFDDTTISSDAAASGDIANGKKAFVNGSLITGTSSGGGGGGAVTQDANGYLVLSDQGGGSSIQVDALSVTQNGTYTAQAGHAYSPVTVNVSGGGGDAVKSLIDGTVVSFVIPNGTTSIRSSAFRYCESLESVTIPSSVVEISSTAFANCTSLSTIYADGAIDGLPTNPFLSCSSLTDARFPNMYGTVASNAFGYSTAASACTALVVADLGSVSTISNNAFTRCAALKTVILRKNDSACSLSAIGAFSGTPFYTGGSGGTVYVPSALVSSYKTETNWSTLYDAGTITFAAIEGSEYEL